MIGNTIWWGNAQIVVYTTMNISWLYRIRPNYAPALITPPPPTFHFIFTYYRPLDDFFLTFYFIFTYFCPLDNLLAIVVENKFT